MDYGEDEQKDWCSISRWLGAEFGAVGDSWVLNAKQQCQLDNYQHISGKVWSWNPLELLASHLDEWRSEATLCVTLLQVYLFLLLKQVLHLLTLQEDRDGKDEVKDAHCYPVVPVQQRFSNHHFEQSVNKDGQHYYDAYPKVRTTEFSPIWFLSFPFWLLLFTTILRLT